MFALPLADFSTAQIVATCAIFVWSGFVRAGLGFGGAVLALPLLLMIYNAPLFWLPILSVHLLVFTAVTLRTRLGAVDWTVLRQSLPWILPAKLIGVFGLLSLPNRWLVIIIYGITAFYALLWISGRRIESRRPWLDRLMLFAGGYFSGTSLSGAPLVAAVYIKQVALDSLRNTLFVLWLILVTIKLGTLIWFDVDPQLASTAILLPIAAAGHWVGNRLHQTLMENDRLFKQALGTAMLAICALGVWRIL